MRLIDADNLAAKIIMEAPDFMDSGSSITKAFILAMVKTRSATPTIDAVPVVRCKDCKWWGAERLCENSDSPCFQNGCTHGNWFCADGSPKEE